MEERETAVMSLNYHTVKHEPFLRNNVNLLKSFCKGIYSTLTFQGNKNAIKYSLHNSEKCIFIHESSTWIQRLILCLKKQKPMPIQVLPG